MLEEIPIGDKLKGLIDSPRDLRLAMGEVNPDDGRLTRWDKALIQEYTGYLTEVERRQPAGLRLHVIDRDTLAFRQSLTPVTEGEPFAFPLAFSHDKDAALGFRVKLGGTLYDADTVLAGLWSQGILGQMWRSAMRVQSPDIGIPYLHHPRPGREQPAVTRLVMSALDAPFLARAVESVLFQFPTK